MERKDSHISSEKRGPSIEWKGRGKRARNLLNFSIIISVFSLCLFFFSDNKADPDLWGHLKFGEDIFTSRSIPRVDTYSYTAYGMKWTNHEWLSEVIFYILYLFLGSPGLLALKILIGILAASLIYLVIMERIEDRILCWLLLAIGLSNVSFGFATRPQIFTYLFFSFYLFCLHRYQRTQKGLYLLFLPPVMLMWTNLHGGFIAGLGTYLIFAISLGPRIAFSKKILIPGILLILATLINPYGPGLWIFLGKTLTMERPYISEWQGLILSTRFLDYYILLIMSIVFFLLSRKKKGPFEVALLAILTFLSIRHNRHIPLFSMMAVMFVSDHIEGAIKESFLRSMERVREGILTAFFLLLSVFFVWMGLTLNKSNPLMIEIPHDIYPVQAVQFIKENGIDGNILPYFDWGEFCIWELHRRNKVFFDGRFETVYPPELLGGYFKILYGEIDPEGLLDQYPQTDIVLMPPDIPILTALKEKRGWIMVFRSPSAVVLLKDDGKNRDIIMRYRSGLLNYPALRPPYYLD